MTNVLQKLARLCTFVFMSSSFARSDPFRMDSVKIHFVACGAGRLAGLFRLTMRNLESMIPKKCAFYVEVNSNGRI